MDDPFETTATLEQDQFSQAFIDDLVDKIMKFMEVLCKRKLYPYQEPFARRVIESVLLGDGDEGTITALWSRQSGKSETVANTVATLMVLLPFLAKVYPDLLGKFANGFWVGMFAPVEGQVETLFNRAVSRLTSDRATEIMLDPAINDLPGKPSGAVKTIELKRSGSFMSMMTANPRAKIESRTFHLLIIDEAQDADDYVVEKSILPMGAHYNATTVKIGTPTTHKGQFWKDIQMNKNRQTQRGKRQLHFQNDWKTVAKYNADYAKSVRGHMLRMGEDSDAFQMSFCLKWLLERGMFTTEGVMASLGDKSMKPEKFYFQTPVVVGIDPARKMDSTVVTVVWVDWDRPDEFGYFPHRILNWLETNGQWEEQYFQIVRFLEAYNVLAVGVDSSGLGDVVADRLTRLLAHKNCEVVAMSSNTPDQSKRWKHLMSLMDRGKVSWPAHAETQRTKTWQRFYNQMVEAEKIYQGQHILIKAPEIADAHDDFVDSFAIACALTADLTMPTIESSNNFFYSATPGGRYR